MSMSPQTESGAAQAAPPHKEFRAEIVCQIFTCNAIDEEDAERKYSAYFDGEDCGCQDQGLECICDVYDEVYHNWEE